MAGRGRADDLRPRPRLSGLRALSRVLVTGAGGFVGRHAVAALEARGHEVVRNDVDLLRDGAAADVVARAGATHLLHLAWYVEHGKFWSAPENELWVEASLRLLDAFGGERAVVAGTCAEYSWKPGGVLSERETPVEPATPYGAAKDELRRRAENVVPSLAWGRIFFLYGPGEDERRLVASVARALAAGEPARVSHGRQVRDFLHVRDVGHAFAELVDSDVEGAVNVGSGEGVSIRELVERLAELAGRPELVELGAVAAPPDEPPLLVADVTRLRDEVGWRPRLTLDDGLADVLSWWRARLGRGS